MASELGRLTCTLSGQLVEATGELEGKPQEFINNILKLVEDAAGLSKDARRVIVSYARQEFIISYIEEQVVVILKDRV